MVKILLESSSRQAKDKKVAWSYGGEIVLNQPDSFLQWDEWLGGWGEQWMLLVLTLARLSALSPISSWTSWESMGWISEQWGGLKKGWLARLKNSHLCCKVQVEVIPYWCNQTLILRSALLNIFINNLSDGTVLQQQVCNWDKTGRRGWSIRGLFCDPVGPWQAGEMDREEPLKLSKEKCRVLPLGRNDPVLLYRLCGGQPAGKQLCRKRPRGAWWTGWISHGKGVILGYIRKNTYQQAYPSLLASGEGVRILLFSPCACSCCKHGECVCIHAYARTCLLNTPQRSRLLELSTDSALRVVAFSL